MNRLLQLNRRQFDSRRFLHFFKRSEIDEPAYHKKPLDPHAISLIKKYEPDIIYSSYLETNKIPLSYKTRIKLWSNLQKNYTKEQLIKARQREPSILISKLQPKPDNPKENVPKKENKITDTNTFENDEFKQNNFALAQSKLKIITELGLRRSALEFEAKSFPDNWMEDYETFNEDESDLLTESHYGTPGKLTHSSIIIESVEINCGNFVFVN